MVQALVNSYRKFFSFLLQLIFMLCTPMLSVWPVLYDTHHKKKGNSEPLTLVGMTSDCETVMTAQLAFNNATFIECLSQCLYAVHLKTNERNV